jgi:hypothetical protein
MPWGSPACTKGNFEFRGCPDAACRNRRIPDDTAEFDAAFRRATRANESIAGSPACAASSRASHHFAKPDSESDRQTFHR